MHAAAQWTAFAGIHGGGTIVMHDDAAPFDARVILETVERRAGEPDLDRRRRVRRVRSSRRCGATTTTSPSLQRIGTGGATTSADTKAALFELIPHVMIIDGYGASETGGMAFGARVAGRHAAGFSPAAGAAVLVGRPHALPRTGRRRDRLDRASRAACRSATSTTRTRTEQTFPIVDGERLAVPGDRATLAADGSIVMLGRDSMVVNTGGEKVFVEEVESALRRHPAVADALVVGRESERFGQEVVGVVQLRAGETASAGRAARVRRRLHRPLQGAACDRVLRRRSAATRAANPTTNGRAAPPSTR